VNGRVCLALPADERYTVLRLRVRRGVDARPPVEIHLKGGSRARVLGLIRVAS
jgi:hypothetical protein